MCFNSCHTFNNSRNPLKTTFPSVECVTVPLGRRAKANWAKPTHQTATVTNEYFAGRKTVVDSNFLQIPDARKRLEDSTTLFTTQSKVIATKIMNTYNASYIYLSPTVKKIYGIEYLPYEDNDCINLIYTGGVRLYESKCTIETTTREKE